MGVWTATLGTNFVEVAAPIRVALAVVPPPRLAIAFDGIRRALGASTTRIPPHCTIAPPVVVEGLPGAIGALAAVASAAPGPVMTRVGPGASFLPATRTIHLAVGDSDGGLARLEATARMVAPFDRPRDRPFVPHVTLHPSPPAPVDVAAVVTALAGEWDCRFDRLTLLVAVGRGADLQWTPIADRALGPPSVVGRGGLEWQFVESGLAEPSIVPSGAGGVAVRFGAEADTGVVVTGRDAGGAVVAVAAGEVLDELGVLHRLEVDPAAGELGVLDHVVAAWEIAARRRGAVRLRAEPALAPLADERGW